MSHCNAVPLVPYPGQFALASCSSYTLPCLSECNSCQKTNCHCLSRMSNLLSYMSPHTCTWPQCHINIHITNKPVSNVQWDYLSGMCHTQSSPWKMHQAPGGLRKPPASWFTWGNAHVHASGRRRRSVRQAVICRLAYSVLLFLHYTVYLVMKGVPLSNPVNIFSNHIAGSWGRQGRVIKTKTQISLVFNKNYFVEALSYTITILSTKNM